MLGILTPTLFKINLAGGQGKGPRNPSRTIHLLGREGVCLNKHSPIPPPKKKSPKTFLSLQIFSSPIDQCGKEKNQDSLSRNAIPKSAANYFNGRAVEFDIKKIHPF